MGTPCCSFLFALLFFIIPFVVPDVEARKFDNGLAVRPGPWKPVTAMTENGPVVGYQNASSRVWKGIPYAAPPIGKLRWHDPQPPQPWGPSPLPAFDYKPACPQHCHLPPGFCATNQSEDCLHLNVWTPSELGNTLLPVMVFFAGGAFFQGDGGVPVYSGDLFVNITNTVLVTCSYRLGALGFLVTDTFTGNFGIKDQREVLKWVARNIKNFGGDPNSITVFGESAGAQSIGVHLASPLSAGLFHRAIMESNPFSLELKHTIAAKGDAAALASLLHCDFSDVSCWLSKTADEIVEAQGKVFIIPPSRFDLNILLQWTPTVDGDQLPMQPLDALVAGKFNKVPIILGSNSNEGVLFVYQIMSKPLTPLEYSAIVALLFREDALEVWEKYSVSFSSNDARMAFAQLLTEYLFGCSTRKAAQGASAAGVPTYLYYYDHPLSFNGYGPNYQFCVGYVCHGCELPLVFDSARESGFNFTTGEAQLSLDIMHYWTNFAKSPNGDPNYGNNVNVAWPTFDISTWQDAWLKVPVEQQQNLLKDHCDMWDRLGYNW